MTEVTRLIEYMEVICDRPYTRDEHHIISQNELVAVYDEFESLLSMVEDAKVKASQRRLKNDKLSAFIEQYAIQLYDYAYRIKSVQDSRNPDANEQAFFYRGVNNASYLIAPGIYRKGEKHDENFYFNEISVRCPQIFRTLTNVEKLTYTLYNKDFTVMDGGIVETDEYRPVQEVMEEVLAEHGHSISECGVISAEYLQEQSYRAETQRAEAMKEKLAAEKPAPEASISFYVAECAEFPVMGEFHDNLTLEQALEVYDKIPAERMNGIKSIGFSLEDGSIYSGMFDLMVGGEVQAEVVNHIQHYRESPLVQKAISDMKTLLEKRQASKELEERPNTRQSVREALKNRKKAQEQQSNQEQAKPKKAKKKGEMEL